MEKVNELLESMRLENRITLDDIPDIDLYMDQVIQLFENKLSSEDPKEKVLTKTMINNYAKARLLVPIKNKKYTKEHIILISLIYQLKGALSINDIKQTLQELNKKITEEDFDLESFYDSYLQLTDWNIGNFSSNLQARLDDAKQQLTDSDDRDADYLERVLLISSLAHMSNLYRSAAEKLVSEIASNSK
ncbi:DUF1836 domain-containing protein [Peribacillus sp. SCS-155]|uniref:DUF1836 domain-containing protein n=1 Tax=Peribacillus sedimenti TaxID=3115297 RepID=UPI003906383F